MQPKRQIEPSTFLFRFFVIYLLFTGFVATLIIAPEIGFAIQGGYRGLKGKMGFNFVGLFLFVAFFVLLAKIWMGPLKNSFPLKCIVGGVAGLSSIALWVYSFHVVTSN